MFIRITKDVEIPQPPGVDERGKPKDRAPLKLKAGEVVSVAESWAMELRGRGQAEILPDNFNPRKEPAEKLTPAELRKHVEKKK